MVDHAETFASLPLPVVGLTGGIASGKSLVAKMFRARGVAHVDADQVARDVVTPGSEGLAAVVAEFGPEYLTPEGELDRKRLGKLVFQAPERRAALEAILHPRIRRESIAQLAQAASTKPPYLIYEAALIIEIGSHRDFAAIVLVTCSEAHQLSRLIARDGGNQEAALRRVRAQKPLEDKLAFADFVVQNDGQPSDTQEQVAEVDNALRKRFRSGQA